MTREEDEDYAFEDFMDKFSKAFPEMTSTPEELSALWCKNEKRRMAYFISLTPLLDKKLDGLMDRLEDMKDE